jgi:hypothetical protein
VLAICTNPEVFPAPLALSTCPTYPAATACPSVLPKIGVPAVLPARLLTSFMNKGNSSLSCRCRSEVC